MADLVIDPSRDGSGGTGIYVRAQDRAGVWKSADIASLDTESLMRFLRSRGGKNTWAESVVLSLLGHPAAAASEFDE